MQLEFYNKKNLGRSRNTMPQIDLEDFTDILLHFRRNNVSVKRKCVPIKTLKPSQTELNHDKIQDKINGNSDQWKTRWYMCGRDHHIVDGHHDYAYGLQTDPDHEVTVFRINLPTKKLIRRLNSMKATTNRELEESLYVKMSKILTEQTDAEKVYELSLDDLYWKEATEKYPNYNDPSEPDCGKAVDYILLGMKQRYDDFNWNEISNEVRDKIHAGIT